MSTGTIRNYKCPGCGKLFTLPPGTRRADWGYAYGANLCCSWSCQRATEAEHTSGRRRRSAAEGPCERFDGQPPRTRYSLEVQREIYDLYRKGYRIKEIADAYGIPKTTVSNMVTRHQVRNGDPAPSARRINGPVRERASGKHSGKEGKHGPGGDPQKAGRAGGVHPRM